LGGFLLSKKIRTEIKMDRSTIYYGQLPRENDLLTAQQSAMVALGKMAEATLGTSTAVDGFAVTPTSPGTLNVLLTPGAIYQQENLEASAWSSLSADISHTIVKQGIQLDPVTFGITPPATFGYSQVFLVQVQYQDLDAGALVLPYYNAALPSSPFSGPGNSGSAQNTVRKGAVASQIKAGIAATTGTQVAPTPDAGWTAIYYVTVANGNTSVSSGNITKVPYAPFIPVKLPEVPLAVQSGKWIYGVDSGSANALVAVLDPIPVALRPGMSVRIKKGAAANTASSTLNVGLGANTIKRATGADLSAGDLPANTVAEFVFDGAYWQYVNFQGFSATSTTNNTYTLTLPFAIDSGAVNALVASFSPAITALADGDLMKVKLGTSITGPATIAINAISAKNLVRPDGTPLRGGDLVAGQEMILMFDGTNVQVVSSLAPNVTFVTGTVHMWPTETVPAGTLECNGAAINRIAYAKLFALIGTIYGSGDGTTTFNLPEMRGLFIRGWDHGSGVDTDAATRLASGTGGVTGNHVGTKQGGAAGPVAITGAAFTGTFTPPLRDGSIGGLNFLTTGDPTGTNGTTGVISGTLNVSGNSGAAETRPKNISLMYVIAY
jgi:microcystin-dependent protein